MDHSAVNARFVGDFLGPRAVPGRRDPRRRHRHGPDPDRAGLADSRARVLALDLSEPMLEQAAVNIAAAGLSAPHPLPSGRREIALTLFGEGSFEGVVSNTIVHHIPDPEPVLDAMARLVARGGTLMVRDLARSGFAQRDRSGWRDIYAGSESPAARALFEASLGAPLTLDEIAAIVNRLGLPATMAMTSDRHWTWTWHRK